MMIEILIAVLLGMLACGGILAYFVIHPTEDSVDPKKTKRKANIVVSVTTIPFLLYLVYAAVRSGRNYWNWSRDNNVLKSYDTSFLKKKSQELFEKYDETGKTMEQERTINNWSDYEPNIEYRKEKVINPKFEQQYQTDFKILEQDYQKSFRSKLRRPNNVYFPRIKPKKSEYISSEFEEA